MCVCTLVCLCTFFSCNWRLLPVQCSGLLSRKCCLLRKRAPHTSLQVRGLTMFSHRYSLLLFTVVHIGGFSRGARTRPIFGIALPLGVGIPLVCEFLDPPLDQFRFKPNGVVHRTILGLCWIILDLLRTKYCLLCEFIWFKLYHVCV